LSICWCANSGEPLINGFNSMTIRIKRIYIIFYCVAGYQFFGFKLKWLIENKNGHWNYTLFILFNYQNQS
jgi:hypothetical protein